MDNNISTPSTNSTRSLLSRGCVDDSSAHSKRISKCSCRASRVGVSHIKYWSSRPSSVHRAPSRETKPGIQSINRQLVRIGIRVVVSCRPIGMEILSSHRKSSPLRRPFAASSSKVTVTRRLRLAVKYVLGLGLLYLVAVYFWGAREAQRRWLGDPDAEENGLGLMDVGGQGAFPSSGLTALKRRLGVPGDSGPDAHAEYFTTEYFIDEHDERNRGILPLREPAEKSCFADEIPGVEPFPLPPRATLYAPVTRSASSDACADALNTNKVAIMMMSKGEIHHTHVWRQWFASAAGRLPVGLDSSCTSLSAETQAACSKFMDVKIPMSEILDDPLAHQILFNLYVHVPPGSEDELDDLFRPFVIPRRVKVAWGTSSMMYAMRELIWFAFQDPRNTRFVLLSESDVPIYGPLPFYHELMAETKSRVDTTTLLNRDTYRWHFRFMCADPPLLERDWRKSSQWFTMIREHAELVLRDVSMYRAFERFCHEFWDDVAYWWRVCYSVRCPWAVVVALSVWWSWPEFSVYRRSLPADICIVLNNCRMSIIFRRYYGSRGKEIGPTRSAVRATWTGRLVGHTR